MASFARQPAVFAGRRETVENLTPTFRPRLNIRHAANPSGIIKRKHKDKPG
jgi:hypothetical protein